MCGILCIVRLGNSELRNGNTVDNNLQKLLTNRGPNLHSQHDEKCFHFSGYVLWQQGMNVTPQPFVTENIILLLNGDIFHGLDKNQDQSDTEILACSLDMCMDDRDVLQLFSSIEGPYSLIFYNRKTEELYVVRDSLGRNSLLIEKDEETLQFLSTSRISSKNRSAIELPPLGIFKFSFKEGVPNMCLYPWTHITNAKTELLETIEKFLSIKIDIESAIIPDWLNVPENPKASFDFSEIIKDSNNADNIFENLLRVHTISATVSELLQHIAKSVEDRVTMTPKLCSVCIADSNNKKECDHCKVGVLFSGGIDCTILAGMMHKFVPQDEPIDLINVAFQKCTSKTVMVEEDWNVPDRISARDSCEELKKLLPERQWNLVTVNVGRDELETTLKTHIKNLIYPLQTVLDESLGCAFWFASRGVGTVNGQQYTTPCRVIIVGSGADELFGGYTRHRNAYVRCKGDKAEKVKCLANELALDWERIPMRNLGRDDRVIADNGKTSRAPFIEENLTKFVNNLDPLQKCCFELEQGLGDKLLLRLCGYKLGLKSATKLKKRAIQFGSRIADKNQNAKDISVNLVP